MNKLAHILVALAVSVLTGLIVLVLVYLIIYNLAPPADPAATGNLGLGQVLLAILFTLIYIVFIAKLVYKKRTRKINSQVQ